MKETLTKLLSLTLCLMMVLGNGAVGGGGLSELLDNFAMKASATTVNVDSGSYGSDVTWSLYYTDDSDENELTLLISGSGYIFGHLPQLGDTPPWFSYYARIKNIVVESGVTGIGMYAFFGCSSCKTVTLPEGMTSIFVFAFGECSSLTSIEIPETVDTIGSSAFSGCRGLKAVTIPSSVTTFGNSVFENCTSLQSVKFLSDVAIPDSTFSGCYNLQTVESPTIVAIPTASLATGNYTTEQTVSLSCSTSGATIYYTTDGTVPTTSSNKYTGAFKINQSTTLKAIAIKDGCTDSGIFTAYYVIKSKYCSTHNFNDNWVTVKNSTCTEDGFKYRTCSDCGFIETSGIDATEHSWNTDYTIDKDSTCTAEGSKSIHCSKCEAVKDVTVIPKKEHTSATDVAVAATCTSTGLTAGSHFSVCNTVLVAQQVTEKKTHNYDEWVTVKDSTCTDEGFRMRTCKDCGFIETSNINISDHEWEDAYTVDKEPTYSESGSESIHCKHCEAVKDSRSIISISEKFEIEKANVIALLNESGETQDNQYSPNITNEAIQDIENYVYDESKSFEENLKEINAIENVATYKVNTYDHTVNACPFLRFFANILEPIFSLFSKLFA